MIEFCVAIEYYGNNRGKKRANSQTRKVGSKANLTMDKGVKLCRI